MAFPFFAGAPAGGRALWKVASFLPEARSHLTMEPSLPEVKRCFPESDATAEVTENRWPRVRRTAVGGSVKSICKRKDQ